MTTWILTIWLITQSGGLEPFSQTEFKTEQGCVAALAQLAKDRLMLDTKRSWIAGCAPKRTL